MLFMCARGGSADKRWRRKIQGRFYFLCAVSISIDFTVPSFKTIIFPHHIEVTSINIVPSNVSTFGIFETGLRAWVHQLLVCMFSLEFLSYIKEHNYCFVLIDKLYLIFYNVSISINLYIYITCNYEFKINNMLCCIQLSIYYHNNFM